LQIQAKEVLTNRAAMLDILSRTTGKSTEAITKDMDRMLYMTPVQAKEYGLIDRVLESTKDLPKAVPALV
jgi:ATP-dependent Clp protease protease subunit